MSASEERTDPWERHAGWWQERYTDGADAEYEEQVLPLVDEYLAGSTRVVDVGCGEGQVARRVAKLGAEVVGVDPTVAQVTVARERGGGPHYVLAKAEAMPLRDASFDAGLSCLVFEHLDPFEPAIAEVGRVLAPGARFMLFLNHPLLQAPGSGWVIDHILDEQYWRVGPYLPDDHAMEEVAPGIDLPFMHRPLYRYVNELAAHGLFIERVEEPPPAPGFLARTPEYTDAATIPRLLLLVTRKRGD
jgi:SAM-dependent methyltransferase